MGEVIQLKIEMSESEFREAWKKECAEWTAISKEMCDAGLSPSAHDVTEAQRNRMKERDEKPLDIPRIYIVGIGWLIPR